MQDREVMRPLLVSRVERARNRLVALQAQAEACQWVHVPARVVAQLEAAAEEAAAAVVLLELADAWWGPPAPPTSPPA